MADLADLADEATEHHLKTALSRIAVPQLDDGKDYCELCGDNIPEARARLGYSVCVPCQEDKENNHR